ncbi:hypothetical protein L6452_23040 [Arctium lappa]|uniref:Uncharacterized protein n=1 Tax=Arctium lappa TaxID=4217 RepID=A0ACB9B0H3_ARCLA|nr:hypothetical protein L6452_23040 [Arctium lappa]
MVAGKRHHTSPSHSSGGGGGGKVPQKGAVFLRSFGVHFPRSFTQVQSRPPDVAELLHLVEELIERESRKDSTIGTKTTKGVCSHTPASRE